MFATPTALSDGYARERDTSHPLTSPQISHSAGRIAAACFLDPNDWLGAKDIIRLPRAES